MANIGDIVQKAFYLGVGLASYATEKAGVTIQELRSQAQKLAEEMVARGEMTADEARKYVDDLVQQAQATAQESAGTQQPKGPRLIEIVSEDEESADTADVDSLREQVQSLQEELSKLKRK
jgi:polyhydroxyalkanoate synthesis regulator phasin